MPPETIHQTTTLPPSPVIVGGPGDGVNSPAGNLPPAATAPLNPPVATTTLETTQPKQVIKIGSKVFSTIEEADAYAQQLEASAIEHVIRPSETIAPNAGTKELIDGRPIEDVIFTDPGKVLQHIEKKVEAKVDAKAAAAAKSKALWDKFYAQNPDLRGKDRVVRTILNENLQAWRNLSEEDGMKLLAKQSREELRSMGFSSEKVETLPRTDAATISSSGEPGTTTQVTTTKAPPSLVDQMKTLQAARRKK